MRLKSNNARSVLRPGALQVAKALIMELLFTGPEGPPGRRTVSQASFIRPCPHASQSPRAGLGAARV